MLFMELALCITQKNRNKEKATKDVSVGYIFLYFYIFKILAAYKIRSSAFKASNIIFQISFLPKKRTVASAYQHTKFLSILIRYLPYVSN